jgi:hypothetical protein
MKRCSDIKSITLMLGVRLRDELIALSLFTAGVPGRVAPGQCCTSARCVGCGKPSFDMSRRVTACRAKVGHSQAGVNLGMDKCVVALE